MTFAIIAYTRAAEQAEIVCEQTGIAKVSDVLGIFGEVTLPLARYDPRSDSRRRVGSSIPAVDSHCNAVIAKV